MMFLIVLIMFIISINTFSPSIDITKEGDILLWYSIDDKRFFKKLFNINIFK